MYKTVLRAKKIMSFPTGTRIGFDNSRSYTTRNYDLVEEGPKGEDGLLTWAVFRAPVHLREGDVCMIFHDTPLALMTKHVCEVLKTTEPEADQPDEPEADQPDQPDEPEADQHQPDEPEADQHQPDEPEADQPETDQPEVPVVTGLPKGVLISPALIDFAKEKGVDLTKVKATGKDKRVLKKDIEKAMT